MTVFKMNGNDAGENADKTDKSCKKPFSSAIVFSDNGKWNVIDVILTGHSNNIDMTNVDGYAWAGFFESPMLI
jgi:hypothetical protein